MQPANQQVTGTIIFLTGAALLVAMPAVLKKLDGTTRSVVLLSGALGMVAATKATKKEHTLIRKVVWVILIHAAIYGITAAAKSKKYVFSSKEAALLAALQIGGVCVAHRLQKRLPNDYRNEKWTNEQLLKSLDSSEVDSIEKTKIALVLWSRGEETPSFTPTEGMKIVIRHSDNSEISNYLNVEEIEKIPKSALHALYELFSQTEGEDIHLFMFNYLPLDYQKAFNARFKKLEKRLLLSEQLLDEFNLKKPSEIKQQVLEIYNDYTSAGGWSCWQIANIELRSRFLNQLFRISSLKDCDYEMTPEQINANISLSHITMPLAFLDDQILEALIKYGDKKGRVALALASKGKWPAEFNLTTEMLEGLDFSNFSIEDFPEKCLNNLYDLFKNQITFGKLKPEMQMIFNECFAQLGKPMLFSAKLLIDIQTFGKTKWFDAICESHKDGLKLSTGLPSQREWLLNLLLERADAHKYEAILTPAQIDVPLNLTNVLIPDKLSAEDGEKAAELYSKILERGSSDKAKAFFFFRLLLHGVHIPGFEITLETIRHFAEFSKTNRMDRATVKNIPESALVQLYGVLSEEINSTLEESNDLVFDKLNWEWARELNGCFAKIKEPMLFTERYFSVENVGEEIERVILSYGTPCSAQDGEASTSYASPTEKVTVKLSRIKNLRLRSWLFNFILVFPAMLNKEIEFQVQIDEEFSLSDFDLPGVSYFDEQQLEDLIAKYSDVINHPQAQGHIQADKIFKWNNEVNEKFEGVDPLLWPDEIPQEYIQFAEENPDYEYLLPWSLLF